jgi:hypothetical protein
MCYSAEASLAASGLLAANSIAIARLPKEKASIPIALIPAIFATHQFVEGMVWLNQDGVLPNTFKWGAVYVYTFIAFVLWPIFVPFSSYLIETSSKRRNIILICQVIGLWIGLTHLLSIIRDPILVSADCCRLSYQLSTPVQLFVPYFIAVSLPFLVSSQKSLILFGIGVIFSCGTAFYLTSDPGVPSLWCFFAAILSGGLYLHFRAAGRSPARRSKTGENLGVVTH